MQWQTVQVGRSYAVAEIALARFGEAEVLRVAPYGMKQLYLGDPDGDVLYCQWRAERG